MQATYGSLDDFDPFRDHNPIVRRRRGEWAEDHPTPEFAPSALFEKPRIRDSSRPPGRRGRVAVIGAGVAGLTAAYELAKLDFEPVVFEQEASVGGRLRTHHFTDLCHGELGGMRIPTEHRTVISYLEELGLCTYKFFNKNPRAYALYRGVRAKLSAPVREFIERGAIDDVGDFAVDRSCYDAYSELVERIIAYVGSDRDRWSVYSRMLEHGARFLDEGTLNQFCKRVLKLNDEVFHFLGTLSGMVQYERNSLIEAWIDGATLTQDNFVTVAGGMQRLPEALRDATDALLQENGGLKIRYRTRVEEVIQEESHVCVGFSSADGMRCDEKVEYVVCAVSSSCCRHIKFVPFDREKASAWSGLTHASAGKTLIMFEKRYWEIVDGIAGGGSFCDLPIQSVYYPSDNAQGDPEGMPIASGVPFLSANGHAGVGPRVRDPEVSQAPGVLTASYTWEHNARRLHGLQSEEEKTRVVLEGLRQLHPEWAIDARVLDVQHIIWDMESTIRGSAFAHFGAMDHERYQSSLIRPHSYVGRPRVFFAGEHLAVLHAWVQGSMQTAICAVDSLVESDNTSS